MNYYLKIKRIKTLTTLEYYFWTNAMDVLSIPTTGHMLYRAGNEGEGFEFKFISDHHYNSFSFIDKLNKHNLSLIQEIIDGDTKTFYFK